MPGKRRRPQQTRSRQKVDRILASARRLIGERGNDAVSMREIAADAGLPISTLYQYFADKNGVLEALMNDTYEQFRAVVRRLTGEIRRRADILDTLDRGIDVFYEFMKSDPAIVTIWAGVAANTQLRDMDIRDNEANARLLVRVLQAHYPGIDRQEAFRACAAIVHTINNAVRVALIVGPARGKALVGEIKAMTRLRMAQLVREGRRR